MSSSKAPHVRGAPPPNVYSYIACITSRREASYFKYTPLRVIKVWIKGTKTSLLKQTPLLKMQEIQSCSKMYENKKLNNKQLFLKFYFCNIRYFDTKCVSY